LEKEHISLFGSAPWTLKTVPDVVTNSEHNHCKAMKQLPWWNEIKNEVVAVNE
jgi:hypothetical protein